MLVASLTLVVGCGLSDNGGDAHNGAPLDLYGGYTMDAEAPGFGDAELIAGNPGDTPYDDEMADSSSVRGAMNNSRARKYMLRMVWGNLDNPDTTVLTCPVTDWSGSMMADGGVVIVRGLIRFEPGDYIVRPRRSAHAVAWVSHTNNHVDGILVEIIDVPDPRPRPAANILSIATPMFTLDIPFDSLADYARSATFDECNGVAIAATDRREIACPRGFLEGKWVSASDTSGSFRGAWVRDDGSLDGFLHGHYTIEDGQRVLFGKWITTAGDFGGLMRGTWGPILDDDDGRIGSVEEEPDGYFRGRWVDEALLVVGEFKGHYCLPEAPDTTGSFNGRWMTRCR
jgi:hypothetical protein